MVPFIFATLAFCSAVASATCTPDQKVASVQSEINTIRSHSLTDALAIPYGPLCSRIFTITPNETKPISIVVPAGVDATTTRAVLVGLGIVLDAGVPQGSDRYTVNGNGSVTVDYIQTDGIALQKVDVREIHSFDEQSCEISGIVGYVRGSLEAFTGSLNVVDLITTFV